ncbi:MAG: hypothetical protein AAGE61_14035 [Pseudomonadota bacterium]
MEWITVLKIAHLIGLMAGLGGAVYTDYLVVTKGVLKPLTEETLAQVKQLSHFVTLGLGLLWISGGLLTYELLTTNPDFMLNEKFWAKVVIVTVLTVNGFVVHNVVLGEACRSIRKRLLFDSNARIAVILTISGSVSFVSWVIPFVLGKAPEFSYVLPFEAIIFFWICAILASIAAILMLIALEEIWRERSGRQAQISRWDQ